MSLILSLVLIITIIILYMLMIQIFTVSFRITGLTKEKARFQVISMLTNSGFSTSESELIMSHKTRRKIAKITMIIGNIFNVLIVSLLINILFNLKINDEMQSLKLLGLAILVFICLLIIIRLPFFRRGTEHLIEKIATKINDRTKHENIITELDIYGNSAIVEVHVSILPSILIDKTIEEANFRSRYNVIILLIQRNGRIIDVKRDTMIQKGDKVVLFGKTSVIRDIFDNISEKELIDESNINKISIIDNYSSNAMVEVLIKDLPDFLVDKTLGSSNLKSQYDINVIMIKHNEKVILARSDSKLNIGDKVILFGPYEHIKTIFKTEE